MSKSLPKIEFSLKSFRLGYHSDETVPAFDKLWSDYVCVQIEENDTTFLKSWSLPACVQTEEIIIPPPPSDQYAKSWSNSVCVQIEEQDESFLKGWSNPVCVQIEQEDEEDSTFVKVWSNPVCEQVEELDTSFVKTWSNFVCEQVEELVEDYFKAWSNPVCVQEASSPEGLGTEESPYLIRTYADLKWLSANSESFSSFVYLRQVADIDASESHNEPVGFVPIKKFGGYYNGDGYTIYDLYINNPSNNEPVGLFSTIEVYLTNVWAVKGLRLDNPSITGKYNVGAFVGELRGGRISQCAVIGGDVKALSICGGFAGIVRFQNSVIEDCYSHANVERILPSNNTSFGGFVGMVSSAIIRYCYSTGKVYSSEGVIWNVGAKDKGFTGSVSSPRIENCLFDTDTSEQDSDSHATGKTTALMGEVETYKAIYFNFKLWNHLISIDVNDGYLELRVFEIVSELPDEDIPGLPEGEGTIGNPYKIANEDNLIWVTSNPDQWDAYFQQVSDIKFEKLSAIFGSMGWSPIGNLATKFTGVYDGKGFVIAGMFADRTHTKNLGLFGVSSGEIKDLTIQHSTVVGSQNTGILVGRNEGTVQNINILLSTVEGTLGVGSVAGLNRGTIENVFSDSEVTGTESVGGLIGINEDTTP